MAERLRRARDRPDLAESSDTSVPAVCFDLDSALFVVKFQIGLMGFLAGRADHAKK
jgi:hypothetical protein